MAYYHISLGTNITKATTTQRDQLDCTVEGILDLFNKFALVHMHTQTCFSVRGVPYGSSVCL